MGHQSDRIPTGRMGSRSGGNREVLDQGRARAWVSGMAASVDYQVLARIRFAPPHVFVRRQEPVIPLCNMTTPRCRVWRAAEEGEVMKERGGLDGHEKGDSADRLRAQTPPAPTSLQQAHHHPKDARCRRTWFRLMSILGKRGRRRRRRRDLSNTAVCSIGG